MGLRLESASDGERGIGERHGELEGRWATQRAEAGGDLARVRVRARVRAKVSASASASARARTKARAEAGGHRIRPCTAGDPACGKG